MSTPIETNGEELREVLQHVYNLPKIGGGGSVAPDLVVVVDGTAKSTMFGLTSDDVSIESGSMEAAAEKLISGGFANVLVKLAYCYDTTKYYMQLFPESVQASSFDDGTRTLSIRFGPISRYSNVSDSKFDIVEVYLVNNGYKQLNLFRYVPSEDGMIRLERWNQE